MAQLRTKNKSSDDWCISLNQLIFRIMGESCFVINILMAFTRVPEDFMKDIFIAPHSFNDP